MLKSRPNRCGVSIPDFNDLKNTRAFTEIAAYRDRPMTFKGDQPMRVNGTTVSTEFFRTLGAGPLQGRTFVPEDEARQVAVISHRFWETQFGKSQGVLGRTVVLDDNSYTVVGVMPPNFRLMQKSDVWIPLVVAPSMRQMRGSHFLDVVARRKADVSLDQARNAVEGLSRQLQKAFPDTNSGWTVHLEPLLEEMTGHLRQRLVVLLGAVAFVLLITCANVSGLLLARAYARQKEFALRMALGAIRRRIVAQLIAESTSIALSGGALGLLFGYAAIHLLPSWSAIASLRIDGIHMDGKVWGFAILVALVSGSLVGVVPAWQAANADLNQTLRGTTGSSASGGWLDGQRIRGALIIGELALAQVLLSGAVLFSRSFLNLSSISPGFQPESLVSLQIPLPNSRYSQGPAQNNFYQQLLERSQNLPQVQSVALTNALPLSGVDPKMDFTLEGRREEEWASARIVTPGYFSTMGISLLQGRDFSWSDNASERPVVVINQEMAKEAATNGLSPLGRQLKLGDDSLTVVGIVANVRERSLASDQEPAVYFPLQQQPQSTMVLVARSRIDPIQVVPDLRAVIRSLDPDQPIENVATVTDVISHSVAPPRFSALILGILASLALVLAMAGVYGLISYVVEKSTHEIGIRVALGAGVGNVVNLILQRGLMLGLAGLSIGMAGALLLARSVSSLLFGIKTTEPLTLAGTALLLLATTTLACWVPALRATRITPVEAIRYDQ